MRRGEGVRPTGPVGVLLVVLVASIVAGPAAAQETPADAGDREAVLRVVRGLFDAMRQRDPEALRAAFHPDARLVTVGRNDAGTPFARTSTVDDFARAVANGDAYLDETFYDPEVRIDGDLAQVWTYYELRVDGTFSHCGVDAFQMVRTAGSWAIVNLADTRRTEGCREVG